MCSTSGFCHCALLFQPGLFTEVLSLFVRYTGADKFSETFLGEFDNPEAIWNNEMRQLMIQKIASHISDFTPRLLSNTRATYQVSRYVCVLVNSLSIHVHTYVYSTHTRTHIHTYI